MGDLSHALPHPSSCGAYEICLSSESGKIGDFSLASPMNQEACEICLSLESREVRVFSLAFPLTQKGL